MESSEEIVYFFDKVKEMRNAQKQYFRTRSNQWLMQAKELEKEVDRLIDVEENPNKNQLKFNL